MKNEKDNKKNELCLLKGILIISVVLGHVATIFMNRGSDSGLYNWLNLFLVSYHMPLFIGVSGYLFYFSVNNHSYIDIIKSKIKRIIVPIIIWSVFFAIVYRENTGSYWYLKALVVAIFLKLCTILICKSKRIMILIDLIVCITLFIIPIEYNYISCLYPFFVCAYDINAFCVDIDFFVDKFKYFSLFVWILMLRAFSAEYTIYQQKKWILDYSNHIIFTYVYRTALAIVAGVCIVSFTKKLYRRFLNSKIVEFIMKCGEMSMEIYLLHMFTNVIIKEAFGYSVTYLTNDINWLTYNMSVYNLIIVPIITYIYIKLLIEIINKLTSCKYTKQWIFGLK